MLGVIILVLGERENGGVETPPHKEPKGILRGKGDFFTYHLTVLHICDDISCQGRVLLPNITPLPILVLIYMPTNKPLFHPIILLRGVDIRVAVYNALHKERRNIYKLHVA